MLLLQKQKILGDKYNENMLKGLETRKYEFEKGKVMRDLLDNLDKITEAPTNVAKNISRYIFRIYVSR